MNFPRHWAKAAADKFECWRWSDVSAADARAQAETAVRAIAERARLSGRPTDRYGYPDRPLREEVLREFRNGAGELTAAITRNAPGCQVLNTARAMFVDVDFEENPFRASSSFDLFGALKRLFAPAAPKKETNVLDRVMAAARVWNGAHRGWGWRVYRTKAGVRLLATHDVFEPDSPLTAQVFEALGADPLYRRLCAAQKSFRARLTPKPWRCGMEPLRVRWPWASQKHEARFAEWERKYAGTTQNFATCAFVEGLGNAEVHPEIQRLVEVHDQMTRIDQPKELA
ncbi:MAG TPA: hypothetical protein VFT34_09915 [Verrucomicrobiae bacterium]|nr:hypothetical protein [Verrucomicrobiae bacterium]